MGPWQRKTRRMMNMADEMDRLRAFAEGVKAELIDYQEALVEAASLLPEEEDEDARES